MRKKFNVIVADPPWKQLAGRPISGGYKLENGKQVFSPTSNISAALSYPTMSVEDICNLDVQSITEKDAHLYLWVTNKYLFEAIKVVEAWGFKYSTSIIWKKALMGGGLGGTFKINHEILLFCRKGNLKSLTTIPGTVHDVKRTYVNGAPCHSKKPDYFMDMIEKISPGSKLEMFARSEKEGWESFGNEIENSIEIPFKN